jgi:uncharacterized protein (TIGR03067 family)
MVRAEFDGETAPDLMAEKMTFELTAGAYIVRFSGDVVDRGTFEAGATAECQTILLRGTSGTNAGRTIPCIYQMKGNRLKVCFGLDGIAPTEFTTAVGAKRYLAMYRREA